jgi:hypothetical protein
VVVAADDVGDFHERVVDGDHVVIDGDAGGDAAGGADEDRVADGVGCKLDGTADQVVEAEGVVFDLEANDVGKAGGEIPVDFSLGESAAVAGINLREMLVGGSLALGFEILLGTEATVGFAIEEEPLGVFGIDFEALGLAVGAVFTFIGQAAETGAFIPVEAKPVEVFHELEFKAGFRALEVSVLNAEDELAAGVASKQPVVESSARVADVEQAGGGRGKSDAWFGDCVHGSIDDRRSGAGVVKRFI